MFINGEIVKWWGGAPRQQKTTCVTKQVVDLIVVKWKDIKI